MEPAGATPFTPVAKVLHNPAMGLAVTFDDNRHDCDAFVRDGDEVGGQLKAVLPKTSVLHIRTSWARLQTAKPADSANPSVTDPVFTWNDSSSCISKLTEFARTKSLKIALHVITDSRKRTAVGDQATPEWVFASTAQGGAGALPGKNEPVTNYVSPKLTDKNFLGAYTTFIKALGARYNTPSSVSYVDGVGLGAEGKLQDLNQEASLTIAEQGAVWKQVTDAYKGAFTKVPLTLDYQHNPDTSLTFEKKLLDGALAKGAQGTLPSYMARTSSVGIADPAHLRVLKRKWPAVAVMAESPFPTYGTGGDELWRTYYNGYFVKVGEDANGNPIMEDKGGVYAMKRVIMAVASAHANTLNLDHSSLINWGSPYGAAHREWFATKGGYRLAPTQITPPDGATRGGKLDIPSSWRNIGTGVLPSSLKQFAGKYRIAYTLLDSAHKPVLSTPLIDGVSDPGKWISSRGNDIETSVTIPAKTKTGTDLKGPYKVAVAIIDTETKQPAIQLALNTPSYLEGGSIAGARQAGWYEVDDITIN
jgi:hypothetical protein